MDRFLELTYQGIGLGVIIGVLLVVIRIFRSRLTGLLLKNPNYAEKNKEKYFYMDSNEIFLYCRVPPMWRRECILQGDIFVIKPDEKFDKDRFVQSFNFSQVAKIEIKDKKHWTHGKFHNINIWRNDTGQPGVPLEYELPDHSFPFRPIALEAAREIERRFNNYVAPQKSE